MRLQYRNILRYAAPALLGASSLLAQSTPAATPPPTSDVPAQTSPSQAAPAPATQPSLGSQAEQPPADTANPQPQQEGGQQPSGSDAGNFVLKVPVNEVNLVFTVTDRSGRVVKNLRQQDFQLLDAKKPPAKVHQFTQQTNLPMRVGLLIDTSSSVHSRFDFEQRSAVDFLQQILRPRQDLAFVMGFDSSPEMTQPFTSDLDKLATGINGLKSNGGTALYDALYKACRDELLPIKNDEPMRKTIVLLSDGHDNQSRVHEDEAIKMCQRAAATVYTISTNVSPTKDVGDDILAEISDKTGGRTFVPLKEEDVAHAFYEISDELRAQYAVVYTPADFKTNGEFRDIWLVPVDRNKYHVRAPKGYFAAREQ